MNTRCPSSYHMYCSMRNELIAIPGCWNVIFFAFNIKGILSLETRLLYPTPSHVSQMASNKATDTLLKEKSLNWFRVLYPWRGPLEVTSTDKTCLKVTTTFASLQHIPFLQTMQFAAVRFANALATQSFYGRRVRQLITIICVQLFWESRPSKIRWSVCDSGPIVRYFCGHQCHRLRHRCIVRVAAREQKEN